MSTRDEQLAAVAEAHYQWTQRHKDKAPFDESKLNGRKDDNYNLHNLDVSATEEQNKDLKSSLRKAYDGA